MKVFTRKNVVYGDDHTAVASSFQLGSDAAAALLFLLSHGIFV